MPSILILNLFNTKPNFLIRNPIFNTKPNFFQTNFLRLGLVFCIKKFVLIKFSIQTVFSWILRLYHFSFTYRSLVLNTEFPLTSEFPFVYRIPINHRMSNLRILLWHNKNSPEFMINRSTDTILVLPLRSKKRGDLRNSLILLGFTSFWHLAQWVSRASPHHVLPAFLNLNGKKYNTNPRN